MNNHLTDTSSIDQATAYRIVHTGRLLRAHLNHILRRQGLTLTWEQWVLVFRLHERDGRPQSDLADPALQDHPNITRMIDSLVKQGYVRRQRDPDDRRRQLVFLTDNGRALMDRLLPNVVTERQKLFAGISPAEVTLLLDVLRRVEENLDFD